MLRETVHGVLSQLTPREAKVLRMRFGIDLTTDHTLEEVGKQFDVTRECIRQIEAKALRKLRHPSRSEQLWSFLVGKTRCRSLDYLIIERPLAGGAFPFSSGARLLPHERDARRVTELTTAHAHPGAGPVSRRSG